MTISFRIQQQLSELDQLDANHAAAAEGADQGQISNAPVFTKRENIWTRQEHERFLEALDQFPAGPWRAIANYVGNKTPRQAMTHGQKYRQKMERKKKKHQRIRAQQEALRSAIAQINSESNTLCVTPSRDHCSTPAFGANHLSPCQRSSGFSVNANFPPPTFRRELSLQDALDLEKECISELLTDVAVAHAAGQLFPATDEDEPETMSTWVVQPDGDVNASSMSDESMVMECLSLLIDAMH